VTGIQPDSSRRQEAAGAPSLADCQPITGDQHWAPVTWKQGASLNNDAARPITLRIELKQSQLFGLQFE